MAYHKFTTISGNLANGAFKCLSPVGHWKPESALAAARRSKIIGPVTITHHVSDMSGLGRGGHDGKWIADENDNITKTASFSEFGKEHV